MITRRSILRLPLFGAALAPLACTRPGAGGFRGYAFVANEEGQAIAALDLEAMALIKHVPLDSNPSQVLSVTGRNFVYPFSAKNGTLYELDPGRLTIARKVTVAPSATQAETAPSGKYVFVLASDLHAISLDSMTSAWKMPLPEASHDFHVAPGERYAAISSRDGVSLIDLESRKLTPLAQGADFGQVKFLGDGKTLIVADRAEHRLTMYDVASRQIITHLPLALRPDQLCFNQDGGQLFVTGEGKDAVVVIYPYHTPEVGETVLAGHAPGPMGVSSSMLLVASPSTGDVSIVNIATRKVIAVVPVGSDPGAIVVTPDDQYALVLNRKSGDVAVIRLGTIAPNRYKSAGLLTVIPVGSKPVSAVVKAA